MKAARAVKNIASMAEIKSPKKGIYYYALQTACISCLKEMDIDSVLTYNLGDLNYNQLQWFISKFYTYYPDMINKGFCLKTVPGGFKIWRWK